MTFDPSKSALPGPNVLLMGDGGTGKTRSLATLVDSGIEVFVVSLEQGLESLIGYWSDAGKPVPANLHWHKIQPPKVSFLTLAENAHKVNTMSYETLAKISDPNRHLHNLFVKVNEAFYNFKDDRTGKEFGDVSTWGPERCIAIDGLTGLSRAAMSLVTGGKPMRSQPDYGMAQGQLEGFLRLICDHCKCWFVLIAHVEKEVDQVNGGLQITVSSIGKALPPVIPPMFSDVVYCTRQGTNWRWNTSSTGVSTKARNLPWAENLEPSFKPLFDKWAARAQAVAAGSGG